MNVRIDYMRVPYWRALRPRYVWVGLGFIAGGIAGFIMGVIII